MDDDHVFVCLNFILYIYIHVYIYIYIHTYVYTIYHIYNIYVLYIYILIWSFGGYIPFSDKAITYRTVGLVGKHG